ncbi:DoxX family protein [Marinilongibacter aquaticus]|uniref:MauE/DoxX family redox-associated membrane protein n=1 Tax=Marinilongibacter aquaticus TaxID=2975157 RepID=UPI0021BD288A|nr:MauE/DoxX family redox-associated membrane protein [Marinilongibacter aquaticus]UBM59528.1 DoxX family protein [Marinilongibacter aquaticus]
MNYFFFRLPMALSLLGHGLVRLPKTSAFAHGMTALLENSYLPETLVSSIAYAVPIVEALTGLFLLMGLFTRQSLQIALALMAIFIFGNTTIENWEAISPELIHAGYLAGLLFTIEHNTFSVDAQMKRNKQSI